MSGLISTPTLLAQVTGTISGTTLTVSAVQSGAIAPGRLFGVGVAAGTAILSGSGSTWTVSPAQGVSSGTLYVISGANTLEGTGARAVDFLAQAQASPVYGLGALTTLAQILPYLVALADQLALDAPALSGVLNKTAPDTRTQTLLAEMIVAAGG